MCIWSFDLVNSVTSEFNGGTLRTVCDSVASKFSYIYMHICVHICVSKIARYWIPTTYFGTLRTICGICMRVAVCCSVLQCVAVRCSVVQSVAASCMLQYAAVCSRVLHCLVDVTVCYVAVCCSVLQRVAVCCSVLQCVAV